MFLLDFLAHFFNAIMEILHLSRTKITNSINIYIKSNTGNTISLDLDPKWDIKNVKEIVAPQLGLEPNDVKIIFAGKELIDSTIIEDCDLGEQSILHAVKVNRRISRHRLSSGKILNEADEFSDADNHTDFESSAKNEDVPATGGDKSKSHFFVYCSVCKSMKAGKLRVRCATCRYGAFEVDNDPESWSHVLEPHQITGECNNTDCEGLYAEFYFKCAEHTSQGEDDTAVPLYLVRNNSNSVPCLACTDVSDPVLVFPCELGHVTCIDCFRNYCSSRLRDRQFMSHPDFGYTLPCPAGCQDSFIKEVHHFRLLTEAQYEQYHKFGAEEFILQAGGVLCPQPGCGAGIIVDPDCDRVQCLYGCNYVFCAKCRQGYHLGECVEGSANATDSGSCEYTVDPLRAEKARWDEASSVTIRVITKPCPKCRTHTERDGGCMHMVCTRANCGYHWCWVCQGPWERDCMGSHWFG